MFLIRPPKWINNQGVLHAEQSGCRPGHNISVFHVGIIDQRGQNLSKHPAAAAFFVDFR
jgi:hypothetical protein